MKSKQIAVLGIIGIFAFITAVLWPSHRSTIPRSGLGIADLRSVSTSTSSPGNIHAVDTEHEENSAMRTATPTITPAPATTTYTARAPKVHMKIVAPNNTSAFDLEIREDDDLCDMLTEAKAAGHIHSLTIDDTYLSTFGSRYVREINGYTNNWTVEVNGVGPEGCSLYDPEAGDTIVWQFGVAKD